MWGAGLPGEPLPAHVQWDSFKWETCRSDNLWTRKFVYKKHFKEENWFPFINELRNRTLWANGATGTGAKNYKLIMGRFNLEINWSFLSAGWEAIVKWSLKPLWKKSWIPGLSPSSADQLCQLRSHLSKPCPSASCQSYFLPSSLLEDGSKGVSLLLEPPLALTSSRQQAPLSRKGWIRKTLPWNSWPWCRELAANQAQMILNEIFLINNSAYGGKILQQQHRMLESSICKRARAMNTNSFFTLY